MQSTNRIGRWVVAGITGLGLALVAGACASGGSKERDVGSSPWLKPSPLLRQQIEDEAERLPWTHGFERLESIRWFASVGEPAYPKLLELALHPESDVAAAALAALGATGDSRLVTAIRGLSWPADIAGSDLALERARTFLRLGDWSEVPVLIEGLKDGRLFTRALCSEALQEATREDMGYDPRAEPSARNAAVDRWELWWFARVREGLVKGS